MIWSALESEEDLSLAQDESFEGCVILFKHSTSCPVSHMAKMRLESQWDEEVNDVVKPFYLDLLSFRSVSSKITEKYGVHHESPQLLLIKDGECIYDASHMDISVDELKETLAYHA